MHEQIVPNRSYRRRVGVHLSALAGPRKRRATSFYSLREILDAIFYVLKSGCAWRLLPHDFPLWKLLCHHFRFWRLGGTWEGMHSALRERVRVRLKSNPQPSAAIVDMSGNSYARADRLSISPAIATQTKAPGGA